MSLKVAELESLFTADVSDFEKGADKVEAKQKALAGTSTELVVRADGSSALKTLDQVEATSRALPDGELEVTADTSSAEGSLDKLEDTAKRSGEDGGDKAGAGMVKGIVAAIVSIPIAGAIVGAGVAIGQGLLDGIEDGLALEVTQDTLMARAGLDEVTAAKFGRAAGEAYANNWGESLEANFDTAKIALNTKLIDPETTKSDAQSVIESLAGVADFLEDDVSRVARSTATLMRNDLAKSSSDAFDIIVAGYQNGLDVSEDWLDTIDEYSTQWRQLGISGPEAIGLLSQAVDAGARDTDKAADALKELFISVTDGSDLTRESLALLNLDADEMSEAFINGGEEARDALEQILTNLRNTKDESDQNTAALGLFKTQFEDLGDAAFAMDLSTAVSELDEVEGAAQRALAAMTDNAQNDIDTAKRNIEVAADGIKGALAAAFGPQIEEWSEVVTENRAGIMEFLLGLANGGIDIGRGIVEMVAVSTESIGDFISGPMADLAEHIAGILDGLSWAGIGLPGAQDAAEDMRGFADSMREADDSTQAVADTLREKLIYNTLDPMQDKLNEVGDQLVWEAEVHDAQVRLLNEIDAIGTSAESTSEDVEVMDGSIVTLNESSRLLDEQLMSVKDQMEKQAEASQNAGESTDELKESLDSSVEALEDQLEAMGLTKEEAKALIKQYGLVPDEIITEVKAETSSATSKLQQFKDLAASIPGSVVTSVGVTTPSYFTPNASGHVLAPMAEGGIPGTALDPIAQMVPPGTLRIVGDRLDVDEAYIPMDGSPRSLAILAETIRRMPGFTGMAEGGISASVRAGAGGDTYIIEGMTFSGSELPEEIVDWLKTVARRARQQKGLG